MKDYTKLYQCCLIDSLVETYADYIYECPTKETAEETVRQIFEAICILPDTPKLVENELKDILHNLF